MSEKLEKNTSKKYEEPATPAKANVPTEEQRAKQIAELEKIKGKLEVF